MTLVDVRPAPVPVPPVPVAPARGGVLAPVLLILAALAAFSVAMTTVTLSAAPAVHAVHAGPVPADYLPIGQAPVVAPAPPPGPDASTGSFTARCGRNADGHRNSANFITAPGKDNGAHHVHDYVGNRSTDRASTDASLAAAGTTCARGDLSVYFWPVLRDVRHGGPDAELPGGGLDGNLGHILTPTRVTLEFLGNPRSAVHPMPRFLRIVTGDAKAVTKGSAAAARALWRCSGTPGRASATRYPLCPAGQLVERVGEFPSCWTGLGTDSADHRTHVLFPDVSTGACPPGTVAIPRLRITLAYAVPPGRSYAVDTFPAEQRKPVTDHFDFENLMPTALMTRAVTCINTAHTC